MGPVALVAGSTAGATLRGLSCNALVIPVSYAVERGNSKEMRREQQSASSFSGTEEPAEPGTVLSHA